MGANSTADPQKPRNFGPDKGTTGNKIARKQNVLARIVAHGLQIGLKQNDPRVPKAQKSGSQIFEKSHAPFFKMSLFVTLATVVEPAAHRLRGIWAKFRH